MSYDFIIKRTAQKTQPHAPQSFTKASRLKVVPRCNRQGATFAQFVFQLYFYPQQMVVAHLLRGLWITSIFTLKFFVL